MASKFIHSLKSNRLRRWASFFVVLMVAWLLLAWVAARALIVRAELEQVDAIVILSGGYLYLERTQRAIELFQQGHVSKIIATTDGTKGPWSNEKQRNPTYTELETEELQRAGIPIERIELVSYEIWSTYEEATVMRNYAQSHGLRSVLIITSPYHSRRALWVWRQVFAGSGIKIGMDYAPTGQQSPTPIGWWWQSHGWQIVAGEYPKFVYYWLKYF